jgi:hypothetical protein
MWIEAYLYQMMKGVLLWKRSSQDKDYVWQLDTIDVHNDFTRLYAETERRKQNVALCLLATSPH